VATKYLPDIKREKKVCEEILKADKAIGDSVVIQLPTRVLERREEVVNQPQIKLVMKSLKIHLDSLLKRKLSDL